MDIKDFALQHKIEIIVRYFGQATDPHWMASFSDETIFVTAPGFMSMEGGRARTPVEAIRRFCQNASNQNLMLNFGAWASSKGKLEPVMVAIGALTYSNTEL